MIEIAPAAGSTGRTRVVALLYLIVGLFQIGSGIVSALIPIRLANSGFPAPVIGWVTTAFSIGFLLGCIAAAALINWLGATRAFIVLGIASAAGNLVMFFTNDALAWAISRGAVGFAVAALLVLVEAWLATVAKAHNRATIFSLYMVLSRLTFVVGQVILAVVDPASAGLLIVATALYLFSPWFAPLIPGEPPVLGPKSGPDLIRLPATAPAAAAASLVHGLIVTTGPALLPLYALARGIPVDRVAILLATIPLGGLLFQLPFSYLSDRFGRRSMMAWSAVLTALLSLIYLLPDLPSFFWLLIVTTLWGGAPAPLYLLAVAHANDISTDAKRVAWASTLLMLWGIGAAIGPVITALLMQWYGYGMLFISVAVLSVALALFLVARKLLRKRVGKRTPAAETIAPAPGVSGS